MLRFVPRLRHGQMFLSALPQIKPHAAIASFHGAMWCRLAANRHQRHSMSSSFRQWPKRSNPLSTQLVCLQSPRKYSIAMRCAVGPVRRSVKADQGRRRIGPAYSLLIAVIATRSFDRKKEKVTRQNERTAGMPLFLGLGLEFPSNEIISVKETAGTLSFDRKKSVSA